MNAGMNAALFLATLFGCWAVVASLGWADALRQWRRHIAESRDELDMLIRIRREMQDIYDAELRHRDQAFVAVKEELDRMKEIGR